MPTIMDNDFYFKLTSGHANILREKPANLFPVKFLTADCVFEVKIKKRLPDSLVVECWHRVQEVPGSIPSQGPRHTKDVIKMAP